MSGIPTKTETELDAMREAARLVSATLAAVAPLVKPGVTTEELDKVAEEFIRDHGAIPAFKGYGGRTPYPATLCVSVNEEIVHGIPGDRILQEGDLASVDCGVIVNGFYGDSAYTFGVGELSDEAKGLCRATYESLNQAIDKCRVGNRIGDISAAVQDYCQSRGYGVVRDLVGHGIGRDLHEPPQVPNVGRKGVGRKLKAGMTICVEPMINLGTAQVETLPDHWTVVSSDRRPSAHYEHMIAILGSGPEVLTSFEVIEAVIDAPYKQADIEDYG